ncbi:MAG TPA: DUF3261 domain-containing protein [Candidatus Tectomicrobia bacterium]
MKHLDACARFLVAVILTGGLTACVAVARDAWSPWGNRLLPPEALGASVRAVQQWHILSGGRSWLILSVLDVSPHGLTLVGLSGFGRRVITLRYNGVELSEEHHPRVPEELEGRRILRELQLIYWPKDAVLHALPPGWHVEDTGAERVVTNAAGTVVHIHCDGKDRWQGHCRYEDLRSGYRLAIDSQVEAP